MTSQKDIHDDRTQEAERRHEKIFTTIAHDLAHRDPMIQRTLANAVRDNELRHTKDIARQWKNFILGPVGAASKVVDTPILVVIDALDKSGEARSREQILHMLAGNVDTLSTELMKLPAHFRALITSRPLDDIHKSLHDMRHVHHCEDERYNVNLVIGKLGSLVTGTDSTALVRPLHASFYDFLTDKSWSSKFFIDAFWTMMLMMMMYRTWR